MENNDILAKAKTDLKDIEKKLWIQAYVSRKENPLIDLIASVLLFICSYLAFYQYFTQGTAFSFLIHAIVFVAITICIVIVHRCLNSRLTHKAEKLCPITTSDFNVEEITSMERLLEITSHGYFDKGKIYYAGPLTALFSIAAWIFSFVRFSKFTNLPVPPNCILYLVVMCTVTSVWFFIVGITAGQSLLLPLSQEVTVALRSYQKEKKQEAIRLQREALNTAKQTQEEKTHAEPPKNSDDKQSSDTKNAPVLYRDLPIYKQYREEAHNKYTGTSSQSNYTRVLTYSEKLEYINSKFSGLYSYHAIETIENDSTLTRSQKEDLKSFLMVYGD